MTEHWEDFSLEYRNVKIFNTEDYDFGFKFLMFSITGKILSLGFFGRRLK